MYIPTWKENPTTINMISVIISMEVTNILVAWHPNLTCTNLIVLTQQCGWHKWNNIFNSIIYWMTKANYMWELFTWTNNVGSGGNDIKNLTEESQLGIRFLNPFVPILKGTLTFCVTSQSSNKIV